MRAACIGTDGRISIRNIITPSPAEGEALVEVKHAALNHLDLWRKSGRVNRSVIPGSDGSGIVRAAGDSAGEDWVGREVIINPSINWHKGEVPGADFEILGEPTNGTFAEYITVPLENLHHKPAHLTIKEAAALPLAALTAWRALFTKAKVKANEKVLITGIGGGAALFLLQFSLAAKARVYVTSSSTGKIEKAVAAGAREGFNYRHTDWVDKAKEQAGEFDVIIDSAGGEGFSDLAALAAEGGRIVLFGRTAGNINGLRPSDIFNKQLKIMGTLMGNSGEFDAMLRFYQTHRLRPVIANEFQLNQISEAYDLMENGNQFGKIIINIDDEQN